MAGVVPTDTLGAPTALTWEQNFWVILGFLFASLMSLLGIAAFCGISHPAMLHTTNRRPLTDDEKFVISLVNARSVETVFEEPQFIGQLPVMEMGDVFVEIPEVLHVEKANVAMLPWPVSSIVEVSQTTN